MKSAKLKIREIGASLVETALIIILIAIVCVPTLTELGWGSTCKMSLAPYFANLVRTGPTSFAGPFGSCPSLGVAQSPDENAAMFWMKLFCNSPAKDPWVMQFRNMCNI